MYIILLRFGANKANAPKFMEGHKAWINQGLSDGAFLLVGSLQPAGGCILAHKETRHEIEARVAQDPFVAEDVVTADILEVAPNQMDERLGFLKSL